MPMQLEAAIVRVFTSNGDVVGTGFFVGEKTILTCAHVIAAALDIAEDTPTAPEMPVCVDCLCWLLSISVPKMSATDGSTTSFSLQSTHQLDDVKVSFMDYLIPDFGTDMLSGQHNYKAF